MGASVVMITAATIQQAECYETGEIVCVNTSAGQLATWPVSDDFRTHMRETIDGLSLKDDLPDDEAAFCLPIFGYVKGDFRTQLIGGNNIYEFHQTDYINSVIVYGKHLPHFDHPHFIFNRGRWGLMDRLIMHEAAHHRGYANNGASAAEECIDL